MLAYLPPFQRIGAVYTPPALITVKSSGVRRATPLVVFGAMPHHAVALDSATGEMAWHTTLQGGFEAAPVVGPDGTVYMGCYDRRLYALDPDTGAIKWTFTATQPIVVPVALAADGTGLYLTSYDRMFYKVRGRSHGERGGGPLRRRERATPATRPPILSCLSRVSSCGPTRCRESCLHR